MAGYVLIKLHVDDAVFLKGVERTGLLLAVLKTAQGFGKRHLIDHDLPVRERQFRNAVAGLDNGGAARLGGGSDASCPAEEASDGDRVRGIVSALVDNLKHVVPAYDAGRNLNAARAPAKGHGHLAAGKGHLIAGYGHGLQKGAADHAFRAFVEIGEIVALERLTGLRAVLGICHS